MFDERSSAAPETRPESYAYPVALVGLFLGASLSFATGHVWIGTVGVVLLSVLSLVYGALQFPDRLD
ncbi:hypothetical protein [Halorientalis halophila]|uniref:hypothetical protein n=1 Tax=Halorientalis halophila TaxID=3108499 RepID=UPI003009B223